MSYDKNDDLATLDDRLKKARSVSQDGTNAGSGGTDNAPPSAAGRAWKMGIELVIAVVLGLVLGKAIDDWLGTTPAALLVGLMIGFIAGIRNVIRQANAMQKAIEEEQSKDN